MCVDEGFLCFHLSCMLMCAIVCCPAYVDGVCVSSEYSAEWGNPARELDSLGSLMDPRGILANMDMTKWVASPHSGHSLSYGFSLYLFVFRIYVSMCLLLVCV